MLHRAVGLGDELLEAGVETGDAVAKQHDTLTPASACISLSRNYKTCIIVSFADLHQ